MADVYAVLFSMLGLFVSLPALLVALNLLLPRTVAGAATRLHQTPGKSLFVGTPVVAGLALWMAIVSQVNLGLIRATAVLAGIVGMGLWSIGAAGVALMLSQRLRPISGSASRLSLLVRGAAVYELACLFPFVGWFLFLPLVGTAAVGAAVFGLVRWVPAVRVESPNRHPLSIEN